MFKVLTNTLDSLNTTNLFDIVTSELYIKFSLSYVAMFNKNIV